MSLKLQEEYGNDLNVLLVEGSRDTDIQVQQFMVKHKWMGGRSLWTRERPFETGLKFIPAAVLLDSSGKVLLIGHPIDLHSQIKDMIDDDLAAKKKAPKDLPDAVGKALVEFNKGGQAKAIASLQAIVDKPPLKDTEGVVPAAQKAIDELRAKIEGEFARVQSLIDGGWYAAANDLLTQLGKSLKGNDALMKKHAEALAKLNAADLKTERDAAEAVARLEKKLWDKGPDNATAKAFESLVEKYPGTKAAARAQELADVAREAK